MVLEKVKDRRKAIELRKKGLSYSEIRKQVKVSKSSLSLWLRSVGLTKRQRQRLTKKKWESIKRGWKKWKETRIKKTNIVNQQAIQEIKKIKKTNEKLWLMGIMLYWAEGAKEKLYRLGQGVSFSNSDYKMIKIFIKWLLISLKIPKEDISFDIYIHENHKSNLDKIRLFWSIKTGFPIEKFGKIYYKKHKVNSLRRNIGIDYNGLLRVKVKRSTYINRKIAGWIEGIYRNWEVV